MVEYKRKIIKTIIDKDLNLKSRTEIKKETKSNNFESFQYLNIGFYLVTPLLMGIFVGLFIDKKLGTNSHFVIIGLLIGIVGTFYNLFRLTKIK